MSFRQPALSSGAHQQPGVWAISKFAFLSVIFSISFCASIGCVGVKKHLQSSIDRSAAKRSFLSWNLRALVSEPLESTQSRAFRIASLSNRELYRLMQTRPAPDLATISGKWNGINKGFGSAMMGLMQDVKVLEGDQCISGYNILVKQVAIGDLPCRGWQPELDPKSCKPKTMGNFIAVAPTCCGKLGHTVKLDYTIAANPWYDPSRFLIDELVAIDDDILLGRATANIGAMHVPVAYFVLTRATECKHVHSEVAAPTLSDLKSIREIVDQQAEIDDASTISDDSATPNSETEPDNNQQESDKSASDKPIVFDATEAILID